MTIQINNLTKYYGAYPALMDLSLQLEPGRIVGLMGENGCGKTTLLKVLAGLIRDYDGSVSVAGHVPGVKTKSKVAFLPDVSATSDRWNGKQLIQMYGDFFADFDAAKAQEMLTFFGLDPAMKASAMSKGMREKLEIAMIMSRNADIYLLDEPISGVDPVARGIILNGIIRGFSNDSLMVLSTHLIHDIEPIVDEAVFMQAGRIVMHRRADEVREVEGKSLDQLFREVFTCLPR